MELLLEPEIKRELKAARTALSKSERKIEQYNRTIAYYTEQLSEIKIKKAREEKDSLYNEKVINDCKEALKIKTERRQQFIELLAREQEDH